MRTRLLASAVALSFPMALVAFGSTPANAGSGVACGNYPTFGNFGIRISTQRIEGTPASANRAATFDRIRVGARLTRDGFNCSGRSLNFRTKHASDPANNHFRTVGSTFPTLGLAVYTANIVNDFTLVVLYNGPDGSAISQTITVRR